MGKHKITPEVHNQLIGLASKLTPFQRCDEKGKLLFKLETELKSSVKEGTGIRNTFERKKVPLLVNHKVNLIACYSKDGFDGVKKYIDDLNRILEQQKNETIPTTQRETTEQVSKEV